VHPSGLKVAERERMRLPPSEPPAGEQGTDDPYAEFPSEPAVPADAPKKHDWLSEFPDEKAAPSAVRAQTWKRLSESVKDENDQLS
jgi:hypothetical protein